MTILRTSETLEASNRYSVIRLDQKYGCVKKTFFKHGKISILKGCKQKCASVLCYGAVNVRL